MKSQIYNYTKGVITTRSNRMKFRLHLEKLKVDLSVDIMSKENTSVSRKYFRHTSSILNWTNWLSAVVCFNNKTPIMSQL